MTYEDLYADPDRYGDSTMTTGPREIRVLVWLVLLTPVVARSVGRLLRGLGRAVGWLGWLIIAGLANRHSQRDQVHVARRIRSSIRRPAS